MTYAGNEASVEGGRPVELYIFTIGATVYRYTSAEDTVVYSANAYLPRQIERSSPAVDGSSSAPMMEITLPTDDPVASRYVGIVPAERVHVEIISFHRLDSPNGYILWNGRIVSAKFEKQGAMCRLFSVSSESALSRPIPGRKFQGLCNHQLYDGGCKVVKASNGYTGTVSLVNGLEITVTGVSSEGADWALGGTVEFEGDKRLIVGQSGDVLTLQIPFLDNPSAQDVDVYAGCDHTLTVCNTKFSNHLNFGGFPFVPTKNPFNTGLE